ncbi:class I SAM-dependent methyltransferase [Mycolicibacterium celeriflavum]|uniref:S-adenosyl-L-methionine-dependent methyltransferase n=1 Tax=Mycolicibacterium celeriflavum TaxID=1249101 RepID=A0A1X0C0A4_MYCCF|nr:class I SAM-dependent methyltransferase [Mycolicibacterium celeriflavum]MCV7236772.1 class I SAM-dependent methyltransferase [Mycolicibacterium celeriflavum]ORA49576.1 SAM-dependent methyltransferase [Mycolicibacterium celeriflavum]BBY43982.1 putative S-adenosyl-L-methionine-dependent methyltransferase [Mycolicibacterium celeriflavum]
MSRTDSDSWDLASSVGTTATMVAAARAIASREDDPLFEDPYAAPLVHAVGVDFFTRLVDGEIELNDVDGAGARFMARLIAVRTRFFDDFFRDAGAAGIRQAVILASGLDSRSYRLPWPAGTVVYEIDQPQVIEFKSATMASLGAAPAAELRTVGVDLREDWPKALRERGFDPGQPAAWSAEGLLVYLPPEAQDRLFDNIAALSAPGSRLATEYHPDAAATIGERSKAISRQWGENGLDLDISDLFYAGERSHVVDYLTGNGWNVSARNRPEVFARYGREFPETDLLAPMRDSLAIIATRN